MEALSSLAVTLEDHEYSEFRRLIYELAGINLGPAKKSLVCGRLNKRLRYHKLKSFSAYLDLINDPRLAEERQIMVDLLTTNETYFFREPKHFDFLKEELLPKLKDSGRVHVWSAACSSGEEPYTLSMIMDEVLGHDNWEILATDISQRVLDRARAGLYPLDAVNKIPKPYIFKYCLKGVRSQDGYLLVENKLRDKVEFKHLNLNGAWSKQSQFDIIFLRNVMIYFDPETKTTLVNRLINALKPGGFLFIGHSETLNGITNKVRPIKPSIYQKK